MGRVVDGVPYIFLQGSSLSPLCILNVGYVIALETVDYSTLLFFRVLVLGFHENLFDCSVALKVSLYPWIIKESIFIRVNNPTLNQNIGKYNLSHIWDRVFLTPQGFNWGPPNSLVQKHNFGSNS